VEEFMATKKQVRNTERAWLLFPQSIYILIASAVLVGGLWDKAWAIHPMVGIELALLTVTGFCLICTAWCYVVQFHGGHPFIAWARKTIIVFLITLTVVGISIAGIFQNNLNPLTLPNALAFTAGILLAGASGIGLLKYLSRPHA
jgi:hypothetical protein